LEGQCETCGRRSELFRLPGRRDDNCAECNTDISMLVLLYRKWEIAERNGKPLSHLEAQLVPMLHRFLERSELHTCVSAAWFETRSKDCVN
jgi:hypothetical protein